MRSDYRVLSSYDTISDLKISFHLTSVTLLWRKLFIVPFSPYICVEISRCQIRKEGVTTSLFAAINIMCLHIGRSPSRTAGRLLVLKPHNISMPSIGMDCSLKSCSTPPLLSTTDRKVDLPLQFCHWQHLNMQVYYSSLSGTLPRKSYEHGTSLTYMSVCFPCRYFDPRQPISS
jgi:hypothetical protein